MFLKIEKIGLILLALLIVTLLYLMTAFSRRNETIMCENMCEERDSPVRVYEPGICICQK